MRRRIAFGKTSFPVLRGIAAHARRAILHPAQFHLPAYHRSLFSVSDMQSSVSERNTSLSRDCMLPAASSNTIVLKAQAPVCFHTGHELAVEAVVDTSQSK